MKQCPECGSKNLKKIDSGTFLGYGAIIGCSSCDGLLQQMNMALRWKSRIWERVGSLWEWQHVHAPT